MIKMFQNVSSASTRQARRFFEENNIDVEVVRLAKESMSYEDFLRILSLTDNGVYDIISDRSNAYREVVNVQGIDLDELKLSELYNVVVKDFTILRTPITVEMLGKGRLVVGADEDKLVKFETLTQKNSRRNVLYDKVEEFDEMP